MDEEGTKILGCSQAFLNTPMAGSIREEYFSTSDLISVDPALYKSNEVKCSSSLARSCSVQVDNIISFLYFKDWKVSLGLN